MLNKNWKITKNFFLVVMISSLLIIGRGIASENSLTKLLPDSQDLGQTITSGYLQMAEGENLVELSNGGAVLFFKHGFKQTVFQEYYIDSTQYINLEIYQMETPEGAKGIFVARSDTSAKQIPLGEQGFQDNYYCTFHREHYYVIVTGSDSTKVIQQLLLKTAEIVDRRIKEKS